MKNWKLALAVACTSIAMQTQSLKAADNTVFGLALGTAFNLPDCPKGGETPTSVCSLGASEGNTFKIRIPHAPEYVWRSYLYADVIEGKMEGLWFMTNGLDYQQRVLDALRSKYGKPKKLKVLKMQNGYGAKFDVYNANWAFKEFTVDFLGVADGDTGFVAVTSPTLAAAKKAAKEKSAQSSPRL